MEEGPLVLPDRKSLHRVPDHEGAGGRNNPPHTVCITVWRVSHPRCHFTLPTWTPGPEEVGGGGLGEKGESRSLGETSRGAQLTQAHNTQSSSNLLGAVSGFRLGSGAWHFRVRHISGVGGVARPLRQTQWAPCLALPFGPLAPWGRGLPLSYTCRDPGDLGQARCPVVPTLDLLIRVMGWSLSWN